MKLSRYLAAALVAAVTLAGGEALANVCRADKLTCPTSMPVGGYCECSSHGATQGGEVTPPDKHEHFNASSGGCGTNPGAPGCR